jgi:hypothetical protein
MGTSYNGEAGLRIICLVPVLDEIGILGSVMTYRPVGLLWVGLISVGCDGSVDGSGGTTSSASTGGTSVTSNSGASGPSTAAMGGSGGGGGGGVTPVDPCVDALFCEKFDDYPSVTNITNNLTFGPWRGSLSDSGATMDLDGTHTTSGTRALHMRIEKDADAGGRLFGGGSNNPIFTSKPTQLYGRMMMYLEPNGSSVHWTFFGASGSADSNSPAAGRRATYLMSSLPRNGVNTYSFVYGLAPQGNDPFHDCYFQSQTPMPTAQWQCVEFELDSVSRKLRMTMDGAATPAVSVDDHGQGCVGDVVPDDGPWYGPEVDQIYVGAWSFHPMNDVLEAWIDDLVIDDQPVKCTPPN